MLRSKYPLALPGANVKPRFDSLLQDAVTAFRRDVSAQYRLIEADSTVCDIAQDLVIRQPLRAYDAVQLASALAAHRALIAANLLPLTFVCADTRIIAVAQVEGLMVDDPNLHS